MADHFVDANKKVVPLASPHRLYAALDRCAQDGKLYTYESHWYGDRQRVWIDGVLLYDGTVLPGTYCAEGGA